jgi:RNA polymerase sigma-70 factor (ECF subfamily)
LATTLSHEEALAVRAQTDRAAFAAVYDHFFRRVYNYVRYRVGEPEAAEDVTAQVFERALRHLPGYRASRGSFAAWLFGIARHAVQDQLRHRRRHPQVSLEAVEDRLSDQSKPDEQVEAAQTRACLLALIATLKQRDQEIIALKFGAGLTNRRIAELTGLSENNVGVILYRTIHALRQKLNAEGAR